MADLRPSLSPDDAVLLWMQTTGTFRAERASVATVAA